VVFIGLMLTVFLAALDQTIVGLLLGYRSDVATALPTIIADLNGSQNYAWVGTSYLLASAAFTPVYGRLRYASVGDVNGSDLVGRKPILYGSILVFLLGSALCGAAQSTVFYFQLMVAMVWLIVARAVQGLGSGSIMGLTQMVISDIVSLEERGKYSGFIGATVCSLVTN
jgi:MFS family permease